MKMEPCKECGEYIDIQSDHAKGCSKRNGVK